MVAKRYTSFDSLSNQLRKHGKFTSCIPTNSPKVKKISDYIYSELISCISQNKFPHYGWLFKISSMSLKTQLFILTAHQYNSAQVKFFELEKGDFDDLMAYFSKISKVYTCLSFQHPGRDSLEILVMYREEPA